MEQNRLAVFERRAGDFWIFWTGQTISQIGSALTNTALPLLVFKLSGSALNLGVASAAIWVPYPLFGLFIGAWDVSEHRWYQQNCIANLYAALRSLALSKVERVPVPQASNHIQVG